MEFQMKQLGNLAIVAAQRNDLCLSIYNGIMTVHIGCGQGKTRHTINCRDDEAIEKFIYELNHGAFCQKGPAIEESKLQTVYVCYEMYCPDLSQDEGAVGDMALFHTKESRDKWVHDRLIWADDEDFIVDEDIGGDEGLSKILDSNDSFRISLFRDEQHNWDNHFDIVVEMMEIQV
jgi:hypothetical protein